MRKVLLAAMAVLALTPGAAAHAVLRESTPPAGATLQQTPPEIVLAFTEEPDLALSSVRIIDATGRTLETGSIERATEPLAVRLRPSALPAGAYTVAWRIVSRVDGHLTAGVFSFGVRVTPPQTTTSVLPSPSPLGAVARWTMYAGLAAMLGGAWVWLVAFRGTVDPVRGFLLLAWVLAALGVVGLTESQRAASGTGYLQFFNSFIGRAALSRAALVTCAGIAIGLAFTRTGRPGRTALAAAGLFAAATMLVHVSAGHAGAATGASRWVNITIQWAHLAAVSVWIGGLAALLAGVHKTSGEHRAAAARRYSKTAAIALAVVVVTGVIRAVDTVGDWGSLISTRYGNLISAKAALLIVLAALGAVNRYRHVPALGNAVRGLRRAGGVEVTVATVVLALTGVLATLPPPRLVGRGPAAPPIAAAGNDFATSIRARLEITPGTPGVNSFVARISDYDTGRRIDADRVSLLFSSVDRPDIGTSALDLARSSNGTYRGDGANLSLAGRWNVSIDVQRGGDTVRVPLSVTVGEGYKVSTVRVRGQPTFYTIDLPGRGIVQAFIDPERPGPTAVHMSFFDLVGRELPLDALNVTAFPVGGVPITLTARRFSAGHFIADGRLPEGDMDIELRATLRGGVTVRPSITVRLGSE